MAAGCDRAHSRVKRSTAFRFWGGEVVTYRMLEAPQFSPLRRVVRVRCQEKILLSLVAGKGSESVNSESGPKSGEGRPVGRLETVASFELRLRVAVRHLPMINADVLSKIQPCVMQPMVRAADSGNDAASIYQVLAAVSIVGTSALSSRPPIRVELRRPAAESRGLACAYGN